MNFVTCKGKQLLYRCDMHKHSNWELIRQCDGNAHARVGNRAYEMAVGDILLIPPHTMHECKHENLFADMCVQFSSCGLPNEPLFIHDADGNIGRLMRMIVKLHTEKEYFYKEIIENLVVAILSYLEKSSHVRIKYTFVQSFKNLLYENISNSDFDLGQAIAESGYHPDYFRRCFKKEYGKSPLEYLTFLRLAQAKELLIQDDFVSIEDVAMRCGFSDSFYFSTCFKKHEGISPLSYRKMNK